MIACRLTRRAFRASVAALALMASYAAASAADLNALVWCDHSDPNLLKPFEDATGITLIADMPGVPRDQLALRIEDDQLIIEGELSMQAPADMEASYVEIQRPRYRRSFTLSKELDSARIGAELNQGVLKLRIPKAESAQPRRIAIQVS
jgi:hypothetical protein